MTERTYSNNPENVITEYQLCPNNCPSQVFELASKKGLTIIVVGAHDGVNGEQYGLMPFLDTISNFKLYLIEPIQEWFDQLAEVYGKFQEKVIYLNYAISEESTKIKMIDQGVMSKIGDGNLIVDSKTWSDFIKENKIKSIDILLLDCEGYEFNILKQINYKRYAPKNIRYEYKNCSEQEQMDLFLKEQGYTIEFDDTDPTYNKVAKKYEDKSFYSNL